MTKTNLYYAAHAVRDFLLPKADDRVILDSQPR